MNISTGKHVTCLDGWGSDQAYHLLSWYTDAQRLQVGVGDGDGELCLIFLQRTTRRRSTQTASTAHLHCIRLTFSLLTISTTCWSHLITSDYNHLLPISLAFKKYMLQQILLDLYRLRGYCEALLFFQTSSFCDHYLLIILHLYVVFL